MNAVRKAAFAATALVITLVGSALATAPMAFARPEPIVAHHVSVSSNAVLVAFNGR